MKPIERIIIHCAATANGVSLAQGKPGDKNYLSPTQRIDQWHQQRGFHRQPGWRARWNPGLAAIGYHLVIDTTGQTYTGRHEQEMGASVTGWNDGSIAICLVGTDRFTNAQWSALAALLIPLQARYANTLKKICGHRDLSPDLNGDGKITSNEWTKLCPGFDVAAWVSGGYVPAPQHIWPTPNSPQTPPAKAPK